MSPELALLALVWPLLLGAEKVERSYDLRLLTLPVEPVNLSHPWPTAGRLSLDEPIDEARSRSGPENQTGDGDALSADEIAGMIRKYVAPESWRQEGNSLTVKGDDLLVVQEAAVQAMVQGLLEELSRGRGVLIDTQVALVPLECIADAEVGRELPSSSFDEALARAGQRGSRFAFTARNGQAVSAFRGVNRVLVVDQEVNMTGPAPVANPVSKSLYLGTTVASEPLLVPGADLIRLKLRVTRLTAAGDPEKRETFFNDLELQPVEEESLSTTLVLEPGSAVLAGTFRQGGSGDGVPEGAVLIRASTSPALPRGSEARRPETALEVHDVAFLLEPLGGEPSLFDADLLKSLLQLQVDPTVWQSTAWLSSESDRWLVVLAPEPTRLAVAQWLKAREEERARIACVLLEELEGATENLHLFLGQVGDGSILPERWRESARTCGLRETLAASLSGLVGARIRIESFTSRPYVTNVELVAGGCAPPFAFPDPVIESAGSGFSLKGRVGPSAGPGRLDLELNLLRCRTRGSSPAELLVLAQKGSEALRRKPPGTGGPLDPFEAGASYLVPARIDLPEQECVLDDFTAGVPEDRSVLLGVRSTSGKQGRVLIGTASVRKRGGTQR